ncbi:MAG: 4-hydroxythreonine-4-phosphate dehydrogenase PdxA, partial [Alphaproteobacteria bacterium]|nr:4-hydroxythreonine-4-phosphate dehydrogenase PdxA [Alphaproteobacteria bacterium]
MDTAPALIAVTAGDPSGIGPDCLLGALASGRLPADCRLVLFGDPDLLSARARALGLTAPLRALSDPRAAAA